MPKEPNPKAVQLRTKMARARALRAARSLGRSLAFAADDPIELYGLTERMLETVVDEMLATAVGRWGPGGRREENEMRRVVQAQAGVPKSEEGRDGLDT